MNIITIWIIALARRGSNPKNLKGSAGNRSMRSILGSGRIAKNGTTWKDRRTRERERELVPQYFGAMIYELFRWYDENCLALWQTQDTGG